MIDETRMSLAKWKVKIDEDAWTKTGKVFQTMEAATGNEILPSNTSTIGLL